MFIHVYSLQKSKVQQSTVNFTNFTGTLFEFFSKFGPQLPGSLEFLWPIFQGIYGSIVLYFLALYCFLHVEK